MQYVSVFCSHFWSFLSLSTSGSSKFVTPFVHVSSGLYISSTFFFFFVFQGSRPRVIFLPPTHNMNFSVSTRWLPAAFKHALVCLIIKKKVLFSLPLWSFPSIFYLFAFLQRDTLERVWLFFLPLLSYLPFTPEATVVCYWKLLLCQSSWAAFWDWGP